MSDTTTSEITALTQQLSSDNLALWDDDKRRAFVATFGARIRVARYLLVKTAKGVAEAALEKHYISDKHIRDIKDTYHNMPSDVYDQVANPRGGFYSNSDGDYRVGGRPATELKKIAEQRAVEIIETMPNLVDAVRILSPEVSKMIDRRAKVLAKGKEVLEEAEGLGGEIDMDDLDQSMTLGDFQAFLKEREKKRLALVRQLDELGVEGRELDGRINKFLYDGLPGLSEAVIKLITQYVDKATAFSALNRRVSEQVQFGDSEAALSMLKAFEEDEATVSYEVKYQFDQALEALKAAAKAGAVLGRVKKLTDGSGKASPTKPKSKKR